MSEPRHILVAVAWPYATGSLHLGHIAGAYLPPDIFARYHRMAGNKVLMVSGSDVHGTPITVKADEEGVSPREIVDRYHPRFLDYWAKLGINFDLFTTTGTDNHKRVAQEFFLRLLENGYLYRHTTSQFYDEDAQRFLPDRYVEGTCPHCGYIDARGDQCDNCGRTLDPHELIDPRSTLSGTSPVERNTEHYYWKLSVFQEPLLDWLGSHPEWRPHVVNFAIGMVKAGLNDRAFTRDLDWGIPIPVDDLGSGKSIYVWWEAVMGYFSAPQEWAQLQGTPDAWQDWWFNQDAESYYFVGKDNIPFHAVYWPALLMGHGGLNLPTNVPGNQYVTFGGSKASESRGVGRSLDWYLDRFEPDALRYAIASVLPEHNDTDLSDTEIVRRVNEELVATWGNLVNRVLSMTAKFAGGTTPASGALDPTDTALLARMDTALAEAGAQIEAVELRAALRTLMDGAQEVNVYLNQKAPWKTAASDAERTGTTLYVALSAINGLKTGFSVFLPFTSARVHTLLGQAGMLEDQGWQRAELQPGTSLPMPKPLFTKIEPAELE
jgi:methionyl-tRNA synthetase